MGGGKKGWQKKGEAAASEKRKRATGSIKNGGSQARTPTGGNKNVRSRARGAREKKRGGRRAHDQNVSAARKHATRLVKNPRPTRATRAHPSKGAALGSATAQHRGVMEGLRKKGGGKQPVKGGEREQKGGGAANKTKAKTRSQKGENRRGKKKKWMAGPKERCVAAIKKNGGGKREEKKKKGRRVLAERGCSCPAASKKDRKGWRGSCIYFLCVCSWPPARCCWVASTKKRGNEENVCFFFPFHSIISQRQPHRRVGAAHGGQAVVDEGE